MTIVSLLASCLAAAAFTTEIRPLPGERWWGGAAHFGSEQPYVNAPLRNLAEDSFCNMCAPLLVSSAGRYVWSERPFAYSFTNGVLHLISQVERLQPREGGKNLREAYLTASARHFPSTGTLPDKLFFEKPQFNTWIESCLVGNGQQMVEGYADGITSNRFPCGVFMIDDGWAPQDRFGDMTFNFDWFPEPKRMFKKLREKGYRTILWTTPYVMRSAAYHSEGIKRGVFMKDSATGEVYEGTYWPTRIPGGIMDPDTPEHTAIIAARYRDFAAEYGFDGFKFDFTDANCLNLKYDEKGAWKRHAKFPLPENRFPCEFTESWCRMGATFPFNELRATWKTGGQPLVCRLQDKNHSWKELRWLIPEMLSAGLIGYAYTCPDMIGGGAAGGFVRASKSGSFSAKLFVRSAQVQALMPMMQFSAAPWRLLAGEELEACRDAAELHVKFAPYILQLADHSSRTGEPIVRHMEYSFPGLGYADCSEQFMLGDRWLIAPVVHEDDHADIELPPGKWRDDLGTVHTGPAKLHLKNIPLSRLPRFELL